MIKTNYGFKQEGKSNFIIVAPHASGDDIGTKVLIRDDIGTGELAKRIADKIEAYFVINTQYERNTLDNQFSFPLDFNRLPIINGKYRWDEVHPHLAEFYKDILDFIGKENSNGKKVAIAYIHGMKNHSDKTGIDIGAGVKYDYVNGLKILKGANGENKHPDSNQNFGVIRVNRAQIEEFRSILELKLREKNDFSVEIGKYHPAWFEKNGIQFHKGTENSSFQIELIPELRKKENIDFISSIIAGSLRSVYI
ncbi:MAG: hypothetical protein Q7S33_02020 [Nanoarchaeota archaeon]|nr:hypothetical protein [Nanoarchaeota archaeon]